MLNTDSPILLLIVGLVFLLNIVTIVVYGMDKLCAKRGWRRVPERTLFLLAILGGSIGAIIGMRLWHHKTLHRSFRYGLPSILIAHIALIVWLIYYNTK